MKKYHRNDQLVFGRSDKYKNKIKNWSNAKNIIIFEEFYKAKCIFELERTIIKNTHKSFRYRD